MADISANPSTSFPGAFLGVSGGRVLDIRRQMLRSWREFYALGVDRVWFALAVVLGLMMAGWLAALLGLVAPPSSPDWILL